MKDIYTDQSTTMGIDRLLKPNEIAGLLNVSRSFTYHLLQTGTIPTVRLGKACRVRPKDLAKYIEDNLHHQVDSP